MLIFKGLLGLINKGLKPICAPVAQLDRVLGFEPRGWGFDSLRAH